MLEFQPIITVTLFKGFKAIIIVTLFKQLG